MKTKTICLAILALVALIYACNISPSEKDHTKEKEDLPTIDTQSLVIQKTCAIILQEDEEEIKAMAEKYNEEDLAEVASDIGFYRMQASETLAGLGLELIYTDKPILRFLLSDGREHTIIKAETENGLIFFRPDSLPRSTPIIGFESDLGYFGIQVGEDED